MQVYLYEQLSNGTVFAHPLPLPSGRGFSAADFDGDGDVDIVIITPNSENCLYFERRGDGSLEQLFGTDNPFNGVCQQTHGNLISPANSLYALLGDWDGDIIIYQPFIIIKKTRKIHHMLTILVILVQENRAPWIGSPPTS